LSCLLLWPGWLVCEPPYHIKDGEVKIFPSETKHKTLQSVISVFANLIYLVFLYIFTTFLSVFAKIF